MGVETKKKDLSLGFSVFGVFAYSFADSNCVSKTEFMSNIFFFFLVKSVFNIIF